MDFFVSLFTQLDIQWISAGATQVLFQRTKKTVYNNKKTKNTHTNAQRRRPMMNGRGNCCLRSRTESFSLDSGNCLSSHFMHFLYFVDVYFLVVLSISLSLPLSICLAHTMWRLCIRNATTQHSRFTSIRFTEKWNKKNHIKWNNHFLHKRVEREFFFV